MLTTVPEERFQTIAALLAREGGALDWLASLQYVSWSGVTKDLRLVSPHLVDALVLDDYGPYVHPGQ